MKGMTVIAAAVAALLIFGGAAVAEQAINRDLARRGADDVAEGGHRGGHGSEPVTATDGQDSKGKALFESKCSVCHGLDRPLSQTKDRSGWTATVKRMQQSNGCRITDAEAQEIIDHLVKVRGKGTPGS